MSKRFKQVNVQQFSAYAEELREMKSNLYFFMLQKLQRKESKDE